MANRPCHIVADVHMVCGKPATWQTFFAYLAGPARECATVYLLGDIFDAWIGDDDERELAHAARTHFAALTASGVELSFIFGNHDFLVGTRFARATGMRLLGESCTLVLHGRRTLLLHGDTLMSDDIEFLAARKKMLRPWYLWLVNHLLSRAERRRRATRMLAGVDHSGMFAQSVCVDEKLLASLLDEQDAQVMVHGHTHLPGKHKVAGGRERWVLPAWTERSGGWLEIAATSDWHLQEGWQP